MYWDETIFRYLKPSLKPKPISVCALVYITNNNINQNFQGEKKSSIRSEVENESDDAKEFSINFTHEIKNKGNITMDFQKEKSNEIEIGIITNTQSVPNFIKYLGERVNTNENQDSELYKIDYVLPLGDDGQFELGFRRSNRYQITDYLVENEINYPVSFNGKMRFKITLPAEMTKEEVEAEVLKHERTAHYLEGKSPKKVIVVPKRIVNIVI